MPSDNGTDIYSSAPIDKVALETNKGIEGIQRDLPSQGDQENSQLPSQADLLQATTEIDNNKERSNELNHFRDQTNLEYGENISQSIPQNTGTPLKSATEITMTGKGMAEQKINEKLETKVIPDQTSKSEQEKNPSEVIKYLEGVNSAIESLNKLRQQYPDNKDIKEQIDKLIGNISEDIKINTPQNNEQKTVKPEEKKDNKQEEDKALAARKAKRSAIIAGVIGGGTGFGVAVAFGTASAVPASIALVAGTITTYGAKRIGERVIAKTEKELLQTGISQEEKNRLEKKLSNWNKVYTWATHGFNFFKGFGIGLAGGSFVSKVFLGGQGLIDKLATGAQTAQTANGIPENNISASRPKTIEQSPIDTTHATSVASESTSSTFDTGLVQNGKVNIPGEMPWGGQSSWNGNLVGPEGGASGRAAEFINNAFKANNLTVSQLQQAGFDTADIHRIMFDAEQQIIKGQTPVFKTLLEQGAASDIPNAAKILSLIK